MVSPASSSPDQIRPVTENPPSTSPTAATPPLVPDDRSGPIAQGDMPAAANYLPGTGSSSTIAESVLSEAEARLQLKRDMLAAGAESPRRSTKGLFKSVCSTDLLFLMDTTGSMYGHIKAAKEQVKSIVADIESTFLNEAEVRIAVVGYKDHGDETNIEFLDFTPSSDRVRSFLNKLTANGGGDLPEDVLGGVRQALNATWQHHTRCIIHIADAPPHGRVFHDSPLPGDRYPIPGSEPHGLTYEPLLKQMIDLNINYALLRINNGTDRMAYNFFKAYAEASAECKLHTLNRYYDEACGMSAESRSGMRSKRSKGGLLFEEAQLGITFSALRHLVTKTVTASASRTAVRLTASAPRATGAKVDKKLDMGLAAIEEDEDDDDTRLDTTPPQWDTPGWLNETLVVEGFSPDVVQHGANTLDDMMAHDDNIMMGITKLTIHKRTRPFAQGAMRVAFYAGTAASTNRFVVKSFKKDGKRLAHLAEDMRCQALCKAFALEFNALSGVGQSIDFIVTTCLKGKSDMTSGDECMSLEPFIEGTYVKYNNNCGYVNEDNPDDRFNQAAQAFSHFTFKRSRGRFLVSDLQGVGHILTDPVIHTLDPERFRLADTNLGEEGFKFFFSTHVCNSVCSKLGLKGIGPTIMWSKFELKKRWPSTNNTVCCSNKLCGRIVRMASAKKSNKYPGYYWCDSCWPQLGSFMVKQACVAPGAHHEYDVSRFFYESQGRATPRRCPEHRDNDIIAPKAPAASCNLWAMLKFARKQKSALEKSK